MLIYEARCAPQDISSAPYEIPRSAVTGVSKVVVSPTQDSNLVWVKWGALLKTLHCNWFGKLYKTPKFDTENFIHPYS